MQFQFPLPTWANGVHHDGSRLYRSHTNPAINDVVRIKLRVPTAAPITKVLLRSEPDGEQHQEAMTIIDEQATYHIWAADLPAIMPSNPYSFIIKTTSDGTFHYNSLGLSKARWPGLFDFKLLCDFAAPHWIHNAVFYQIFPDRFANGDPALNIPDGRFVRYGTVESYTDDWDAPVKHYSETRGVQFFGGDIPGIIQKLDYLQDLGINAIYLNPIFSASTYHRYNIEDFYSVDEHLGGNNALIALREALTKRGMRLILDVTPNHSGDQHPWFKDAQADINAPSAEYYTFYEHPNEYAHWTIARSLPKFNYNSQALRDVMYGPDNGILLHWLRPPYSIDGWRLDVFNMTGRQGELQVQHEVAREMRDAVKSAYPASYFMGESFFDATEALQGDQLDGVMNYTGFTLPLWEWLRDPNFQSEDFALQSQRFFAAIPWQIAQMQFNLLGSHDTERILHIAGDDMRLAKMAVLLLMTFPGVPCVYYGDEIGMSSKATPENRTPMRWDEADWNIDLQAWYKRMIAIRHASAALKQGGYQLLYAKFQIVAYSRATADEHLIVIAHRGPSNVNGAKIPLANVGLADGTRLRDLLSSKGFAVEDGHITLPELTAGDVFLLSVR